MYATATQPKRLLQKAVSETYLSSIYCGGQPHVRLFYFETINPISILRDISIRHKDGYPI